MSLVYILYNVSTGEILQGGSCPDETCLPEKPEGCEFAFDIPSQPDTPETKRFVNGELVDHQRERTRDELISAIEVERQRRLDVGFDYDFKDARGVHRIGTTSFDEKHWDKVTKLANAYIASGRPEAIISITTDTGPVDVTALEWQQVLIAAGEFQQPIYARSFTLQAFETIPQDIENEVHWL